MRAREREIWNKKKRKIMVQVFYYSDLADSDIKIFCDEKRTHDSSWEKHPVQSFFSMSICFYITKVKKKTKKRDRSDQAPRKSLKQSCDPRSKNQSGKQGWSFFSFSSQWLCSMVFVIVSELSHITQNYGATLSFRVFIVHPHLCVHLHVPFFQFLSFF